MEKGDDLQHTLKETTMDTTPLDIKSEVSEGEVVDAVNNDDDETKGAAAAAAAAAAASSVTDNDVQGMTSLQVSAVANKKQEMDTVQGADGAVGWEQSYQPPVSPPPHSSIRYSTGPAITIPPSQVLPKWAPEIEGSESLLRDSFIKHITKYEGVAIAPSEEFELQWAVMAHELEQIIKAGLIPHDSIASSGLNENSYKDFKICAEELQSNLFEGKVLESLSNLRGFRRLFSRSSDDILRHAFRGQPTEVLQNIYYGGDGVLPEDRMILDDPFHHTQKDETDDFMFDD